MFSDLFPKKTIRSSISFAPVMADSAVFATQNAHEAGCCGVNTRPGMLPQIQTVEYGERRISIADALRLGIRLRAACEQCRLRKLRCSGVSEDGSACLRCSQDGSDCYFGM